MHIHVIISYACVQILCIHEFHMHLCMQILCMLMCMQFICIYADLCMCTQGSNAFVHADFVHAYSCTIISHACMQIYAYTCKFINPHAFMHACRFHVCK